MPTMEVLYRSISKGHVHPTFVGENAVTAYEGYFIRFEQCGDSTGKISDHLVFACLHFGDVY